MDSCNLRTELKNMLKGIYQRYDSTNTGSLDGEKRKMFMKDLNVSETEAATFLGFEQKYFNEFEDIIQSIEFMRSVETVPTTKKCLNFKINWDDSFAAKTIVSLNYIFNEEKRRTILVDLFPDSNLNVDETFLVLKMFSSNPLETKNILDNIIKTLKILIKCKNPNFPTDDIVHDILISDEIVIFKIYFNNIFFSMLIQSLKIFSNKFVDILAEVNFNIEMKNSFDDVLNHVGENNIKILLNGSKLSFGISSNMLNIFREFMNKRKKLKATENTIFTIFTFLDINGDFNLDMGNESDKIFFHKIPQINVFDQNDPKINNAFLFMNKILDNLPILKNLLKFLEGLKGKFDLILNTSCGLLRLKFESAGLLQIWDMMKMIFY